MGLPEPPEIRTKLEKIAAEIESAISKNKTYRKSLPEHIADSIDRWKFGKTGFVSPTNILLTSAWVKALNPNQDIEVCFVTKVGGYNGRDMDEKYTVPLVSKYRIYEQFCSRNSGFQGSRQIENQKRSGVLSRTEFTGNVRWDTETFFDIMEGINSNSKVALCAFYYLLEKGFQIKKQITDERQQLLNDDSTNRDKFSAFKLLTEKIVSIKDPQFHKALIAAFMLELGEGHRMTIAGLDGARTGADARDRSPGDLWMELAGEIIEGVEVKDPTHSFDWRHIAAALDRIQHHQEIILYTLVTTGNKAISDEVDNDEWLANSRKILEETGTKIRAVTFTELLEQNWYLDFDRIVHRVSTLLAGDEIPDIKPGTLQEWRNILNL